VLAREIPLPALRAGDLVVFAMAGAYAWNISHTSFLMHPSPAFVNLPLPVRDPAPDSASHSERTGPPATAPTGHATPRWQGKPYLRIRSAA